MTEQKFRHALLAHLKNLEPSQFSYDVRRTAHALLDASAELDRKICADATPAASPVDNVEEVSEVQCNELSAEDRAYMFIDWCALNGISNYDWPPGVYKQLVAHLRAMQSSASVVAKSATTADLRRPSGEIEELISRYQDADGTIWKAFGSMYRGESTDIDRAIRALATEAAAISRAETIAQLRVVSQEASDQGCMAICDTDGQRNSLRVGTIYHAMIDVAVKGLK